MDSPKRLPSLRSLRAFQVAGRHLSFKKAAEELFISASAVSHQVKNLEAFLGIELFERKTRALDFTDAGKTYFAFLDQMFSRLEAETYQLRTEFGRRIVRLCVPPFFASEALLPKLSEFNVKHPGTDIRLSTQPSRMKEHASESDLSVLLGQNEWPDLETCRLFSRQLVTACAPSVRAVLPDKGYKSLNGQTLIVHEHRPMAWENWARRLGIKPPRAGNIIRFDSMADVVQGAVQGLGIALVSWPLGTRWFESGQLVRVFPDEVATRDHFFLAHRKGDELRPEVAVLRQWIIDEFRTTRIAREQAHG